MRNQSLFLFVFLAVPAVAAPPPPVAAVAFHPGGKFLVAGTHGDVAVIDTVKGEVVRASADKPAVSRRSPFHATASASPSRAVSRRSPAWSSCMPLLSRVPNWNRRGN